MAADGAHWGIANCNLRSQTANDEFSTNSIDGAPRTLERRWSREKIMIGWPNYSAGCTTRQLCGENQCRRMAMDLLRTELGRSIP
jgi:hypothetical protein